MAEAFAEYLKGCCSTSVYTLTSGLHSVCLLAQSQLLVYCMSHTPVLASTSQTKLGCIRQYSCRAFGHLLLIRVRLICLVERLHARHASPLDVWLNKEYPPYCILQHLVTRYQNFEGKKIYQSCSIRLRHRLFRCDVTLNISLKKFRKEKEYPTSVPQLFFLHPVFILRQMNELGEMLLYEM